MKNIAVITAGGSGKRMRSAIKKQFMKIGNDPVIVHTLRKFTASKLFAEIILVIPEEDVPETENFIKKYFKNDKITLATGADERQKSVFNGLKQCPPDTDYVFIHDGVRPFVDLEDLNLLLKKAKEIKAVIPVTPARCTIKKCRSGKVTETVPRDELFEAHTPQVFDFSLISELHKKADEEGVILTDDAGICEYYGHEVGIIESCGNNIKITHPQDIKIAEIILEAEKK
ncbi:MAG: 2-C-methyl-D-erythritol 4-phosphate cytidylyltransferase [Candidatus Cloacimonadota bacterium]|nr:MAG: 2-C-methyl-D-erythritol 4-phosphate cytidylyltransferase [Candidatus Cloacimonadota bacterium]